MENAKAPYTACQVLVENHLCETSSCGKPLRASATTCAAKAAQGPRLMPVPNGNNAEDWAIRRRAATGVSTLPAYAAVSETAMMSVCNDGCKEPNSMLKVQSGAL